MLRLIVFSTLIFIIVFSMALPDELALLEINDNYEVIKSFEIIGHAHGTINGKFIVELNYDQARELQLSGITPEMLRRNCRMDNTYLVYKEHNNIAKSAIAFEPLYAADERFLVELSKGDLDILSREGFIALRLSDRQTPFFYNPPLYAMPSLEDYPTDTLAEMVNLDSLYSYVQRLEDFYTRFTPSDSCIAARNWIGEKFESFGYTDVEFDYFLATREWMGVINEPAWNVICFKEGTEKPDEWIMIGAHYDSYASNGLYDPAPGADDNASGVAAVLELARIFKDYDFKRSLMFVAFAAEEQWMDGSYHLATELYEDSTDIEIMVNYDVIAYEADEVPEFYISSVGQESYCQVFLDARARLNDLIPFLSGSLDDDAMFDDYGYQTLAMWEYTFHPDMHTPWDLLSTLDVPYMRKMIQLSATALPIIDASMEPVVPVVRDIGDGQSLRVTWDSCYTDCSYKVVYGKFYINLTDTADVPSGSCSFDLTGLDTDHQYFVTVFGYPSEGYPQIGYVLTWGRPMVAPRQPAEVVADIDSGVIILSWQANTELDLSHYKILRKIGGGQWNVLIDNYGDTTYYDYTAVKYVPNFYAILACDYDENESDTSAVVHGIPASFDAGLLLVEETQTGGINPLEKDQSDFYNYMFSGYDYTEEDIDSADDALTRSVAGQYNTIFWVDDDNYNHVMGNSIDTLMWFLSYNTDFLLAGWETIYTITGQKYFYPGSFYYDDLGISYIAQNPLQDFIGPEASDGWPALELKPDAPYSGRLPDIDVFTAAPKADVIYTYNSFSQHPFYHGRPVGIALDTYHGKRVVLGFPLYWLTEESALALMTRVFEYFAEESFLFGDVNGDWEINILDITYLINYLYKGGNPPADLNDGDTNGDCIINLLDITRLISYLYKNGPAPVEGCIY